MTAKIKTATLIERRYKNMDDFEKQLQRQSLRKVPGEWRVEILREGRRISVPEFNDANRPFLGKFLSTLNRKLSTFFWPHPKAWAGLAVIWIAILFMNVYTRDSRPVLAKQTEAPSPQVQLVMEQQRRLFNELLGPTTALEADRPKIILRQPRSEMRRETAMA